MTIDDRGLLVFRKWSNSVNQLKRQNIMKLEEVLQDQERPFYAHYGAVVGLMAFGTEVCIRVGKVEI